MAAATIFSSKGESLPRPRFFSIPFFWGKEDLRINHPLNDLKKSLTAPSIIQLRQRPSLAPVSSLVCHPCASWKASEASHYLWQLLQPSQTSHSLFTCVKPEANPAAPSRGDWHQLWSFLTPPPARGSLSGVCPLLAISNCLRVALSGFQDLYIPSSSLSASPRQPAPKTANTGLQHHCFPPLSQGMGDKRNTSFRVQQRSWKQYINPNPCCSSPCASVSEDLLVADQAEETGLLTQVNHMKAQSKQAWLEASMTS